MPTSFLPEAALPENWNKNLQQVYGEKLPGLLNLKNKDRDLKVMLILRRDTHRLMDVRLVHKKDIMAQYAHIDMEIKPMNSLKALPVNNATTSFFEETGPRKGYVKGSYKPFERLLMSWWSFDLYVGEDKAFCPQEQTGAFYTSLKFWAREESDMKNFPQFLQYWGWKL